MINVQLPHAFPSHSLFDVHRTAISAKIESRQIRAVTEGTERKEFSGRVEGMTEEDEADKSSRLGPIGVYDSSKVGFLMDKKARLLMLIPFPFCLPFFIKYL